MPVIQMTPEAAEKQGKKIAAIVDKAFADAELEMRARMAKREKQIEADQRAARRRWFRFIGM